ncbi:hypothetical protein AGMMS49928_13100 [Spirochaetia bacterium]|nr:hypothetical protein AGMMS49928_13100 [Spirochaetia bacterium]
MSFERPLFILFAFLFIPVLILGSRFFKSIFTLEIPLGPPGGISFKAPAGLGAIIKILQTLELLGVFLFFVAAAGPRFTFTETLWLSRGADILFVMDISPSMAGLDMDGQSRFDLSRSLIRDFAEKRPPDAIGLAALGSDAALLLPPTVDREALYTRLETLRIGELGDGTALGMGIATAALHLRDSSAPRRALVLITDGENNAGNVHPETAAALLPDLGISFWIIAVGSSGEVSIDYVDPVTRRRRTGTFDSRFDSENLRALAQRGGGTLISAPQADAFAAAFARLDSEEMVIRRSGIQTKSRPFHAPVLVTALILVGASYFIRRYVLGALL